RTFVRHGRPARLLRRGRAGHRRLLLGARTRAFLGGRQPALRGCSGGSRGRHTGRLHRRKPRDKRLLLQDTTPRGWRARTQLPRGRIQRAKAPPAELREGRACVASAAAASACNAADSGAETAAGKEGRDSWRLPAEGVYMAHSDVSFTEICL